MAEPQARTRCAKCVRLRARVAELEAQLAAARKHSGNSSKPSSGDIVKRRLNQARRADAGQHWCERLWTVVATCARQGRSAFDFMRAAVAAHFRGEPGPSLRFDTAWLGASTAGQIPSSLAARLATMDRTRILPLSLARAAVRRRESLLEQD
jgi:hypothetical protein